MEVNELAQWVVLVFMGVFLLGLTRQLGAFMRPHSEELADMGPALGTEVPSALVDDPYQVGISGFRHPRRPFGLSLIIRPLPAIRTTVPRTWTVASWRSTAPQSLARRSDSIAE